MYEQKEEEIPAEDSEKPEDKKDKDEPVEGEVVDDKEEK
jgi:hypothetical protein